MNKVPCEICGIGIRNNRKGAYYGTGGPTGRCHIRCHDAVEKHRPQMATISEPAKQIVAERGKVLVHLKNMARTFKRGCCNRGLVWATACATIKQAGVFSPGEQQDMLRRWDRLAGFAE